MNFKKSLILLLLLSMLLGMSGNLTVFAEGSSAIESSPGPEVSANSYEDTTAPTVQTVAIQTPSVEKPGTASIALDVTEEGSGITYIDVQLETSGGSVPNNIIFGSKYYTDEPKYSGTITLDITIPITQYPGVYNITRITVEDAAENSRLYIPDNGTNNLRDSNDPNIKCTISGDVTTITVTGDAGDITAPTVQTATILTPNVEKPGTASIALDVTEEWSGITSIDVQFETSGSGGNSIFSGGKYLSSPEYSGTITLDIPVPITKYLGVYSITRITVEDAAGNSRLYIPDGTNNLRDFYDPNIKCTISGDVTTITVTGDAGDITAPTVQKATILTPSVRKPGTASIALDVTEEWSGITYIDVQFETSGSGGNSIFSGGKYFSSPEYSGTITLNIPVSITQYLGVYNITRIWVEDAAGNSRLYIPDGTNNLRDFYDSGIKCSVESPGVIEVSYDYNVDFIGTITDLNLIGALNNLAAGKAALVYVVSPARQYCTKAMLDAIKGMDRTLIFYYNGIQWAFNGLDITGETKDIRMDVVLQPVSGDVYGFEDQVLRAAFYSNGQLPGAVYIRVQSSVLPGMNNVTGALFLYYLEDGTPVQEDSEVNYFENGLDGWCKFYLNHNSTFLISSSREWHKVIDLPKVASPKVVVYSATSNKLTWKSVSGAKGYEILRSDTIDGEYTKVGVRSYSYLYYYDKNLMPNKTYYYKIQAYRYVSSAKHYGTESNIVSATPVLKDVAGVKAGMYSVTSNKISWSAVPGRIGYEIWWSDSEGGEYARLTSATKNYTSTYIYHTNITPEKTYYYKVKAYVIVNGNRVYSTESEAVPAYSKVGGVKAAMYSVTGNKISWGKVAGTYKYEVWKSDSIDTEPVYWKQTAYTYIYDTKLVPNKPYYYKVRAYIYVNGSKVYSGFSDLVTATPVFNNVTNVKAYMYSVTSNKISWGAVSGRTGYEVSWSESEDGTYTKLPSTTYTYIYHKEGIDPEKTYYYKVAAYVTVNGEKQYSAESASIPAYSKVNGVKGYMYSVTSNKISWSSVSGRSGYEVWWSETEDGTYTMLPVTAYTYIYHKVIDPEKTYYYKVRAYQMINGEKVYNGKADMSDADIVEVKNKVNGAKAACYSYTTNKISWSPVSGRDYYEIWRYDAGADDYLYLGKTGYTYYYDKNLTTDTTYSYKVCAYDTAGGVKVRSGFSDVVYATPSLKAVSGAKAARYNSTKIMLTWYSVPGATGYEIERCTTGVETDFINIKTTTTTSVYYYNGGLSHGTKYYYRIRAYRTVGENKYNGGWSKVVYATP